MTSVRALLRACGFIKFVDYMVFENKCFCIQDSLTICHFDQQP